MASRNTPPKPLGPLLWLRDRGGAAGPESTPGSLRRLALGCEGEAECETAHFFTVLIFIKKCFKNFISSQHNINLKGKSLISGMLEIHIFICDCFL